MQRIPRIQLDAYRVIAIGASTGAPGQVEQILAGLPADLSVPILLAQHLPPQFTAEFSRQLDRASPLTVVEAEDGMPVYPGVVFVGRGHQHMRVKSIVAGKARVVISPEPADYPYKPSADELFASCASVYGAKTIAVVMTGIGHDGTKGAGEIFNTGGMVIAQSPETCAVNGMPGSCVKAGFASHILTPDQIRRLLLQLSPLHGADEKLMAS